MDDKFIFSLSPNVTGSSVLYETVTNQWYYLQEILNTGDRHIADSNPLDWSYVEGRVFNLFGVSGVSGVGRTVADVVKELQVHTNGVTPDENNGAVDGFTILTDTFNIADGEEGEHLNQYWGSPAARAAIISAVYQAWYNQATNYSITQFQNQCQLEIGQPNSYVHSTDPTPTGFTDPAGSGLLLPRIYTDMADARANGLNETTRAQLDGFFSQVWPNVDWADALSDGNR
jgi:hypothetical protein